MWKNKSYIEFITNTLLYHIKHKPTYSYIKRLVFVLFFLEFAFVAVSREPTTNFPNAYIEKRFCFDFYLYLFYFVDIWFWLCVSFLFLSFQFYPIQKVKSFVLTLTVWSSNNVECFSICFESFKSFKFMLVSFSFFFLLSLLLFLLW